MHWSQQTPSSNNTREDSAHGHHQMVNTEIRLIIFFAAKDRETLYSQQKQDRELTVAQSMNILLPMRTEIKESSACSRRRTGGLWGRHPFCTGSGGLWGSCSLQEGATDLLPGPGPAQPCLGSKSYLPVVPAATRLKAALRGGGRRAPAGTSDLGSSGFSALWF